MTRDTYVTSFKDDHGREWVGPNLYCRSFDEADEWLRMLKQTCCVPANTRLKGRLTGVQEYDAPTGMWLDRTA